MGYTKWIGVLIVVLVMFLCPSIVSASSMSRHMPTSPVEAGSQFNVRFYFSLPGQSLALEETLPAGFEMKSWHITGAKESDEEIRNDPSKFRIKGNSYGWSLTPDKPVQISYIGVAPLSPGVYTFSSIWIDDEGPRSDSGQLKVIASKTPVSAPAQTPRVAPPPDIPSPRPVIPTNPTPDVRPVNVQAVQIPTVQLSPSPTIRTSQSSWSSLPENSTLLWGVSLILLICSVCYYYSNSLLSFKSAKTFCPECKTKVKSHHAFCLACGTKIPKKQES